MSSFDYIVEKTKPFRMWLIEWRCPTMLIAVFKPKGRPANRLWVNDKEWDK